MASVRRDQGHRYQKKPVSSGSKTDPPLSKDNPSMMLVVPLITYLIVGM